MTRNEELPSYRQLPVRPDAPPGSSWGLWGDDDQLGTLNLLTDERTQRAAALVRRGVVFPLNLPLHEPQPQLAWRTPPTHHILHVGHEARGIQPGGADDPSTGLIDRDDYLDGLWLQAGSQWDSLSHVRHRQHGNYNGIADQEIHGGPGTKLGVDQWARRAIVGRGVLVDVARHLAGIGRDYDPNSAFEVTVEDLEGTLAGQGLEVKDGDILLLHTGWMRRFLDADADERGRMIAWETIHTPGLEPSERMVEWLWDHHLAAVASDTAGVEALSPDPEFFLHLALLPLLGCRSASSGCWTPSRATAPTTGSTRACSSRSRSTSGAGSAPRPRRSRSSRPGMARASPWTPTPRLARPCAWTRPGRLAAQRTPPCE